MTPNAAQRALLIELDDLIFDLTLARDRALGRAAGCDAVVRFILNYLNGDRPDVADARMTDLTTILSAALEKGRALRRVVLDDDCLPGPDDTRGGNDECNERRGPS